MKKQYKAVIIGKPMEQIDPIVSITINNGYDDHQIPIEDWIGLRIKEVKTK